MPGTGWSWVWGSSAALTRESWPRRHFVILSRAAVLGGAIHHSLPSGPCSALAPSLSSAPVLIPVQTRAAGNETSPAPTTANSSHGTARDCSPPVADPRAGSGGTGLQHFPKLSAKAGQKPQLWAKSTASIHMDVQGQKLQVCPAGTAPGSGSETHPPVQWLLDLILWSTASPNHGICSFNYTSSLSVF